jgi:uncharacterized membrane protein
MGASPSRNRPGGLPNRHSPRIDRLTPVSHRLSLAGKGAVQGAVGGGLLGTVLLAPLLGAAVGAASGAVGAERSAGILNAMFVREVKEVLKPGRAALFLVVSGGGTDPSRAVDALRPLSPRVVRTTLSEAAERRLLAAFTGMDGGATGQRHAGH